MNDLTTHPTYTPIISPRGGWAILYTGNGRSEFLGTDGRWERSPIHCDPFDSLNEANARIIQLTESN